LALKTVEIVRENFLGHQDWRQSRLDREASAPVTQHAISTAISLALVCLAMPGAATAQEEFRARLTPMPVEVATRDRVTGSGSASAVFEDRQLVIRGSFAGMRGPATVARLHESPTLGVRGPALFDLKVTRAADGAVSGNPQVDEVHVDSLLRGLLYIQIHSESAPEGNLWGWLLPVAGGK
jgi:hypothetical protein